MKPSNSFFSTFNTILLIGVGLGVIILCGLIGLLYTLWENPSLVQTRPTPYKAPILATLPPTSPPLLITPSAVVVTPTATSGISPTQTPSSDSGNYPPPTGQIVFTCYTKQVDQVCLMNADGSGRARITKLTATAYYASLSLSAGMIYFSSRETGNFEIYSIRTNGNKQQRLTKNIGSLFAPELSPNGQEIVFTNGSSKKPGIWVMDPSGDNPHNITKGDDIDPTWSPDGSMISFASARTGARQLFVMNADGSDIRQVTKLDNMGGRSTWSPDGKKLAFYAGPTADHNIYVINVDGTGLVQLTKGGDNLGPSWSPDGNWIAFTSFRDGNNEIYIMHPDGTAQTRITNDPSSDWQPRWGR